MSAVDWLVDDVDSIEGFPHGCEAVVPTDFDDDGEPWAYEACGELVTRLVQVFYTEEFSLEVPLCEGHASEVLDALVSVLT